MATAGAGSDDLRGARRGQPSTARQSVTATRGTARAPVSLTAGPGRRHPLALRIGGALPRTESSASSSFRPPADHPTTRTPRRARRPIFPLCGSITDPARAAVHHCGEALAGSPVTRAAFDARANWIIPRRTRMPAAPPTSRALPSSSSCAFNRSPGSSTPPAGQAVANSVKYSKCGSGPRRSHSP